MKGGGRRGGWASTDVRGLVSLALMGDRSADLCLCRATL